MSGKSSGVYAKSREAGDAANSPLAVTADLRNVLRSICLVLDVEPGNYRDSGALITVICSVRTVFVPKTVSTPATHDFL